VRRSEHAERLVAIGELDAAELARRVACLGTVCAMSQARVTRGGAGPPIAAWWSASTDR
jgi:hypothetical protein